MDMLLEAFTISEIFSFIGQAVAAFFIFIAWGFLLIHAMQNLNNVHVRTHWLLLFICFNVIAIPWYFFVVYRKFYKQGKGGLLKVDKSQLAGYCEKSTEQDQP